MFECNACDGLGYFIWPTCSEPGCCMNSRTCPFCNGEGEAPSVVFTDASIMFDPEYDSIDGEVSWE